MKISVDGEMILELSEIQKKVICNDICVDCLEDDLKRRLKYILEHKYEQCFERLKKEWEPKLCSRVNSLPTNPDDFAKVVFSQEDYEDRKQKDLREEKERINP